MQKKAFKNNEKRGETIMEMKDVIRKKRRECGLTQEQVASFLGVSTPAVNKWESGVSLR